MNDTKIYLITIKEKNEKTGKIEIIVSHGVGDNTLKNYILPNETLDSFKPNKDDNGHFIYA